MRVAALALVLVSTAGCEKEVPTQVLVLVEAQPPLDMRIDRVVVSVQGGETPEMLDSPYTQTIDAPPFPLRIAIVPAGGDASRTFRVEVVAYEADTIVGTVRARGQFVENRLVELTLVLEACCADIVAMCTNTQTCRSCACMDEMVPDGGPPVLDGGGIDAMVPDGSAPDGGGSDGGALPTCVADIEPTEAGITNTRSLELVPLGTGFALVYENGPNAAVLPLGGEIVVTDSSPGRYLDAIPTTRGLAAVGADGSGGLWLFESNGLTISSERSLGPGSSTATSPAIGAVADTSFAVTYEDASRVFITTGLGSVEVGPGVGASPLVWSPSEMRWFVAIVPTTYQLFMVPVSDMGDVFSPLDADVMTTATPKSLAVIPVSGRILFAGAFGINTLFVLFDPNGMRTGDDPAMIPYPMKMSGTIGASGLTISSAGTGAGLGRWITSGGVFVVDVVWIDTTTGAHTEPVVFTEAAGTGAAGLVALARNGLQWMIAFGRTDGLIYVQRVCPE